MCCQHVAKTSIFPAKDRDSVAKARTLQNYLYLFIYLGETNNSQALNLGVLVKGKLHTVLYWQEQSTNFRGRCRCQYNSYVKNSKLCNNLTYKEFIAVQKLTFISSSASWCAVWVKQQHVCSVSAPTVWMCRSPCCSQFLILFLFFVSVFVNWCFFVMCEFDDFFHVAGCVKRTAVVKESHGKSRAKVTL